MPVRKRGGHPAAGRALQEPLLDEERLQHILDRVAFLADRGGEILDADGPAGELVEHGAQELAVHHVEARGIDVEHRERTVGHGARDRAIGAHFGEVAHAPQQPVDDARRAAGALRDLQRARADRSRS